MLDVGELGDAPVGPIVDEVEDVVDVGDAVGPDTDAADDTVGIFVEPAITTFEPLLSAGVSYIIA